VNPVNLPSFTRKEKFGIVHVIKLYLDVQNLNVNYWEHNWD